MSNERDMTSFEERLNRIDSTPAQAPRARRSGNAPARLSRFVYGVIWMAIPSFGIWNVTPVKEWLYTVPALANDADTLSSVLFLVFILWILFTFGAILRPIKKALWFLEDPSVLGYLGSRYSFYDAFGTPSVWFALGTILGFASPVIYIFLRYS